MVSRAVITRPTKYCARNSKQMSRQMSSVWSIVPLTYCRLFLVKRIGPINKIKVTCSNLTKLEIKLLTSKSSVTKHTA